MGKRSQGWLVAIVALVWVLAWGVTPASAGAAFPKMEIKLGHSGVVEMSYHKGSVKFAELMKERTGGAVTVDVFPANQLGSEKDMLEQVKNGVIHISLTGPSMLGQFKGWGPIGVLGMPYVPILSLWLPNPIIPG
jgi:TRAP-type C4-dicarboxylate transport system substrate-binding protein